MRQIKRDHIVKVVRLGNAIRQQRAEGNLHSVPPPTIYGYIAFLNMFEALPNMNIQQIAVATLLGNASTEDRKQIPGVLNEIFGINSSDDEDSAMGGVLI